MHKISKLGNLAMRLKLFTALIASRTAELLLNKLMFTYDVNSKKSTHKIFDYILSFFNDVICERGHTSYIHILIIYFTRFLSENMKQEML